MSTLYEFNLAAAGYWRNWERFTKWAVREINYIALTGNPYIKKASKPNKATDLYELSIDKDDIELKKSRQQKFTDEEIEQKKRELHGFKNTMAED